jgi:radical SAM protein with 4Fe4S-binding SPASM domain
MLDKVVYEELINQVAPFVSYLTLYFQGEPYLNPHFLEFVKYASEKNIFTATSTNAHYFDEEMSRKTVLSGLDKLIISIDGTDQNTYEKYRVGGNLDKVIQGTERLIKWKKKLKSKRPFIVLQFLVFKSNQHQLNKIKELAEQLGVDKLNIKTAQIYNFESKNDIIPNNSKYSRYKKANSTYTINNTMSNNCWRMWSSCVITWDGKMVPCCFDKDAQNVLGDVYKKKFIRIWKSEAQQEFRKRILKSRKDIDICKNCSEGCKIWV